MWIFLTTILILLKDYDMMRVFPMATLAFDVYGTLIDTYGMIDLLQRYIGAAKARSFASLWRDKQLEYSFRRSMMNCYEPFHICTSDALDYCIDTLDVTITQDQHMSLIESYKRLPLFEDVVKCLSLLTDRGNIHVYALTNGSREDVATLFTANGIDQYFKDIISVDEIHKYKPDPAVYQHFLERSGSRAVDSWLISANGFDVIGAGTFGMNSVWVKRLEQQRMDPWGRQPTKTIWSLSELDALF